ncbi:hypothetical protein ACQ4M3_09305 [Leptolyngbya sp. AN03gr2]|uniref:hypothetical protein n=1 Tax=Leptolyngbya sp. AN03gr2 TaxID=3423364 RepID=UPI003D31DEA9
MPQNDQTKIHNPKHMTDIIPATQRFNARRPQNSVAYEIQTQTTVSGDYARNEYSDHLRVDAFSKEYFVFYRNARGADGKTLKGADGKAVRESPFLPQEDFGVLDAAGNQITHRFVAMEGDIIEPRMGYEQSAFNLKGEGEAYSRCKAFKMTRTNALTEEETTTLREKPLNFFAYLQDYETKGYNTALKDRGIMTFGEVDRVYGENRLKEYILSNGDYKGYDRDFIAGLYSEYLSLKEKAEDPDAEVKLPRSAFVRDCETCILNGWNIASGHDAEGKPILSNGKEVSNACSGKGELLFLVRRLAIRVKGNALRWFDLPELGIDGMETPFVAVLEKLNMTDQKIVGRDPNQVQVSYGESPWIPSDVKTMNQYLKSLNREYPNSVVEVDFPGLTFEPDLVYSVPTQLYLAPTNMVNGRKQFPLFSAAFDRATTEQVGLERAYEAWVRYNVEKAKAMGLSLADSAPEIAPAPQTVEPQSALAPAEVTPPVSAPVELKVDPSPAAVAVRAGLVNNGTPPDMSNVFSSARSKK